MRTILVVDDEWAVADVLESLLDDEGYRVVTASNGRQALERLREVATDVIITDFMMPVMDGSALLEALAADRETASIPVVMMSSLPESAVRERCRGYAAFMRKPFRVPEVLAIVEAVQRPR